MSFSQKDRDFIADVVSGKFQPYEKKYNEGDYQSFVREVKAMKLNPWSETLSPVQRQYRDRWSKETNEMNMREMARKDQEKYAKMREADRIRYGGMEMGYSSGSGSESEQEQVEERRVRAMQRKRVEEKVAQQVVADRVDDATELMRQMAIGKGGIDKSDIFSGGLNEVARQVQGHSGIQGTGMSQHIQYGEKHTKAKLNDETAQAIRREYWGSGGAKHTTGGSHKRAEGSQNALADKYGMSREGIKFLLNRSTWIHLPQVEGEPDENMTKTSMNDRKVIKLAKELGVEPIRNKIGRLALPEDVVLKLRSEASKKGKATKKVKPELTEEEKAEKKRIANEKRQATKKANKEKKLAEGK